MKSTATKLLFIWIFVCFVPFVFGQTRYYISSINGNDANSGTSSSSPWKSITKLNSALNTLQAGAVIYLERGSTWYEVEMKINGRSGTTANPISICAYGSGPRPILSGGKLLHNFAQSGNIYSISIASDFPRGHVKVPTGILINGKWQDIARSSEYFVTGSNNKTQITDYSQNWTSNEFTGSYVFLQPVQWHWTPSVISSNTTNTLYFNEIDHKTSSSHYSAYYIANSDKYLNSSGEWTFKNRTLKIFYNSDLNAQNVQFSTIDSILSITNCNYINIQDIVFELANFKFLSAYNSHNLSIKNCEFRYTAGEGVFFQSANNIKFENNYVHDCGSIGLRLYIFGPASIRNNLFKRIATQNIGMANYEYRMGPAISIQYPVNSNLQILYNLFDSVGLAIQGHTFNVGESANIRYNYVENYGVTISDCAAFYFASDLSSNTYKNLKRNIIKDAITAGNRYLPYGDNTRNPHPALHPHAFYFDVEALAYLVDSNSIEGTCVAFYSNRNYKNVFKHNNVVNADKYAPDNYNSVIMKDQAIGFTDISADRDTCKYNNIVLSNNPNARVYLRHTITPNASGFDNNQFSYDFNKIASPFNSSPSIGRYVLDYGNVAYNYSLAQMQSDGGLVAANSTDQHSLLNPQGIMYSSVSNQVSAENFVKFFTNFSKTPRIVNLGNATFRDINGNNVSGTTTVPPFYSTILFYTSGNINTVDKENYIDSSLVPALFMDEEGIVNHSPVIYPAQFTVNQTNPFNYYIGAVTAEDPDHAQGLTYSIISGNSGNYFSINNSGGLNFTTSAISFTGNPTYNLVVRVQDNGSPSLYSDASVTIRLISGQVNQTPVMANQHIQFQLQAGINQYSSTILANDPDGDDLTFSIVSGNPGFISINSITGALSISIANQEINVPVSYNLLIQVTDNGSPVLSRQATIEISIIPYNNTLYVDPSQSVNGDGTIDNPFNSLNDISFENNHLYLIKRGTSGFIDNISMHVNNVYFDAYGEGDLPIINSLTDESVIEITDHSGIDIRNLHFKTPNAVCCLYILGPEAQGIIFKDCIIEGADFGVRLVNAKEVRVENCIFADLKCGVFSIAEKLHLSYNIFRQNIKGIEIVSTLEPVEVYNNVFFDNRQSLKSSVSNLEIFNNIFYLTSNTDQAIISSNDDLISDYNDFFPVKDGFVSIGGVFYNSLTQLRDNMSLELNSVNADPDFVDSYNNNFRLNNFSPVVDAGKNLGLLFDIDGVAIPHGQAPDMGAFEKTDNPTAFYQPVEKNTLLNLFPNPASDILNVQFFESFTNKVSLRIVDLSGKITLEKIDIENPEKHSIFPVNTSNLQPGIYILKVLSSTESFNLKFIKN